MKTFCNTVILLAGALLLHFDSKAQSSNTLLVTGLQPTVPQDDLACKVVHIIADYHYKAAGSIGMHAHINPAGLCDEDYTGSGSGRNMNSTCSATIPALNKSLPVGAMSGAFSVSQTGAAAYAIPILTPPGTGAVAPQIAIVYNSMSTRGLLGLHWNLSGFSAITRTGKDIFHNGSAQAVNLDSNDPFELDGQTLIKGTTVNEYYTESESYKRVKITSVGPTGPLSFLVETKDGYTLQYGYTDDSKIEFSTYTGNDGRTGVYTWLLNKVTDSKGNYMKINYHEEADHSEWWPESVQYTLNDNSSSNSQYNEILFYYNKIDADKDQQTAYVAGRALRRTVLLDNVVVKVNGVKSHEYDFNYCYNIYSHLSEVSEKGSDGNGYNSTVINWNDDNPAVTDTSWGTFFPAPNGVNTSYFYPGDYVGDGAAELLRVPVPSTTDPLNNQTNDQNTYVYGVGRNKINNNNLYLLATKNIGNSHISTPYAIQDVRSVYLRNTDLDGDGKDDFVYKTREIDKNGLFDGSFPQYNDRYYTAYFSSVSANKLALTQAGGNPVYFDLIHPDPENTNNKKLAYDIGNSTAKPAETIEAIGAFLDGTQSQLLVYEPGGAWHLVKYSTTGTPLVIDGSISMPKNQNNIGSICFATDFNGNGKADFMLVSPHGTDIYELNNNNILVSICPHQDIHTQTYYDDPGIVHPNNDRVFPGDFNGDGKTDLLVYFAAGANWKIAYSTGLDFVMYDAPSDFPAADPFYVNNPFSPVFYVADFNGDGKSDILVKDRKKNKQSLYLGTGGMGNNGLGFAAYTSLPGFLPNVIGNTTDMSVADFNGDGAADIMQYVNGALDIYTFNSNKKNQLVKSITNGLNYTTAINYNSLSNYTHLATNDGKSTNVNYTAASDAIFPVIDFQKPMYVVSQVQGDDGLAVGTQVTTSYNYGGAKLEITGRGFMGFTTVSSANLQTGYTSTNTYDFDYIPYLPFLKNTAVNANGVAISSATYTPSFAAVSGDVGNSSKVTFFLTYSKIVSENKLKGTSTTTTNTYDTQHGNLQNSLTVYNNNNVSPVSTDAQVAATYTWYNPSLPGSTWFMSQPASKITASVRGTDTYTRTTDWSGYDGRGLPSTIVTDAKSAANKISTSYAYDMVYGNPTYVTVTGDKMTGRSTQYAYDNQGRFITDVYDPKGFRTRSEYDPVYGNITKLTDPNGLVTYNTYDPLGRLSSQQLPNGQIINVKRDWASNSGNSPLTAVYFQQVATSGDATETMYYDLLGRQVRGETTGFDGSTPIFADNSYDNQNRLVTATDPYYKTDAYVSTSYAYDPVGRLASLTEPSGKSTAYQYQFTKTTATQNCGTAGGSRTYVKVEDATGLPVTSTDPLSTTSYEYHPSGQPSKITSAGAVFSMSYYDVGLLRTMTDPDAGLTSYIYDALGETTFQRDNAGNIYAMTYDELGRILSKSSPAPGTDGDISYSYDTFKKGLPDYMETGTKGFDKGNKIEYAYDKFSRPSSITESVLSGTGGAAFKQVLTTGYSYDANNRVSQVTYPSKFVTDIVYNASGYCSRIKNHADASAIWTASTMNARNQLLTGSYGNGVNIARTYLPNTGLPNTLQLNTSTSDKPVESWTYSWDEPTGNLTERADLLKSLSEKFTCDQLDDRLNTAAVFSQGLAAATPVSLAYDANGNIHSKSDAGTYAYSPAKPHAVSMVTGFPLVAGPPVSTQSVNYTAFNKIRGISQSGQEFSFYYDPAGSRCLVEMAASSKGSSTVYNRRFYAQDYQKDIPADKTLTVRELDYIASPDGLAAIHVHNGTKDSLYYIHTDYLGSILAITDNSINNPLGRVLEERSYDAWGLLRNAGDWHTAPAASGFGGMSGPLFERGYTGHEHMPLFGLINMNGRLYDPMISRMLSPDNDVQDPGNSQHYNRYTYALNNPLKYTDPTGYDANEVAVDDITQVNGKEVSRTPSADPCDPFDHITNTVDLGDGMKGTIHYDTDKDGHAVTLGKVAEFVGDKNTPDPAQYADPSKETPAASDPGTITASRPNLFDDLKGAGLPGRVVYDALDGAAVALQSLVRGPDAQHLTGEPVSGNDRVGAFVNTASMFVPFVPKSGAAVEQVVKEVVVEEVTQGGARLLSAAPAKLTQQGLEHIVARHWATSGAKGAGKFLKETTANGLKEMIETATTKGVFRPNTFGRAGTIAEYDFGRVIGTTSSGSPASSLRVVIGSNGNVITAFPH